MTATKKVLSTLTLPNGKEYQFFYNNSYGLLSEIIFPDGGWIKYTYQLGNVNTPYNEQLSIGGHYANNSPVPYGCVWQYQTPVLASRTVSFDGTNVAQTQTFAYTTAGWQYSGGLPNDWTTKTTTVTTTDNKRNLTSQVVYSYGYTFPASVPYQSSANAAQIPQEKQRHVLRLGQIITQQSYEGGVQDLVRRIQPCQRDDNPIHEYGDVDV